MWGGAEKEVALVPPLQTSAEASAEQERLDVKWRRQFPLPPAPTGE